VARLRETIKTIKRNLSVKEVAELSSYMQMSENQQPKRFKPSKAAENTVSSFQKQLARLNH